MKAQTAALSIVLILAASCALTAPVKDVCKDCVDPYAPTAERSKFFAAAGVDNELDAKEFVVDQGRPSGFVRKFDSWPAMLPFDKDQNVKLDWFEADAYRRALRGRVLAAYDANKDGHLTDKERDAANRALAAGKLPPAPKPAGGVVPPSGGRTGPGQGGNGPIVVGGQRRTGVWQPDENYLRRVFDKNRDGKLDETERSAADKWQADYRKRREEYAKKAAEWRKIYDDLRKKHDVDGDGKLDETERKAYYEDYRAVWQIRRWDKNGDGKLDEEETAAKTEQEAKWKKLAEDSRRRWMLQRWDKDKDGQISQAEQDQADKWQEDQKRRAAEYRERYARMRKEADADGDGKLNAEENKAYYQKMRDYWNFRRADTNGDGKLDDAERKALQQQRSRWNQGGARTIRVMPGAGGAQLIPGGAVVNVTQGPGMVRITPGGEGAQVWTSPDGRTQGIVIVRPMVPRKDEKDE